MAALETDECATGPCNHGGTCIDGYKKFQCLCLPNFEVPNSLYRVIVNG